MVNLVFMVDLKLDPTQCSEYGKWIEHELFMILSAEGSGDEPISVNFCGVLTK